MFSVLSSPAQLEAMGFDRGLFTKAEYRPSTKRVDYRERLRRTYSEKQLSGMLAQAFHSPASEGVRLAAKELPIQRILDSTTTYGGNIGL